MKINETRKDAGYSARRVYQARPITLGRSLAFGVVDLMGGGWNTIISGLLLYFFVTYGHVTAVEAGLILFIARIVDAVASLLIGPMTDNFYRNRLGKIFGRRHFFLLIGAPVLLLTFPLLWIGGQGFWYYLAVYLLIEIVMAFILIPWETLPTEMTNDYTDRTKLSSTRMFLSATGTFIVFFIPAQIKATGNPDAYFITGLILSVLFAAAVATTYRFTWERALTDSFIAELDARPRMSALESLKSILGSFAGTFKNRSFVKHLTVYLLSFTGKDMFASSLTFYIVYTMHKSESFGLSLQALSIIGIPVTIMAGFLMVKRGPRWLWTLSFSIIIASLLALGAIYLTQPKSAVGLLIIVCAAYQAGRAILEFTPWNVYPFIPDIDRIMTRQDRAGIYAAVMTFGRKSTGALATLIVSAIIEWGGFVSPGTPGRAKLDPSCTEACPVAQTETALHTIVGVTVFGPMTLIIIALVIARRIHLDAATHAILHDEIARLEAGGAKGSVSPEAKAVAEDLTGKPYDELWPETDDAVTVKTADPDRLAE